MFLFIKYIVEQEECDRIFKASFNLLKTLAPTKF